MKARCGVRRFAGKIRGESPVRTGAEGLAACSLHHDHVELLVSLPLLVERQKSADHRQVPALIISAPPTTGDRQNRKLNPMQPTVTVHIRCARENGRVQSIERLRAVEDDGTNRPVPLDQKLVVYTCR
jgi:hypothetical protein